MKSGLVNADNNIDYEQIIDAFGAYVQNYDVSNIKIKLKYDHSIRVSELCKRISQRVGLSSEEVDTIWIAGLFHDIGRFDQIKMHNTFNDDVSFDHAKYGANLLVESGLLDQFLPLTFKLNSGQKEAIRDAIFFHNAMDLPYLKDDSLLCCNILRDADKIDIFKIISEIPYEKRNDGYKDIITHNGVDDDVMNFIYNHKSIPRKKERSVFEAFMAQCSMAFDLNYEVSRQILIEQGSLNKLLNRQFDSLVEMEQIRIVQSEIYKDWQAKDEKECRGLWNTI